MSIATTTDHLWHNSNPEWSKFSQLTFKNGTVNLTSITLSVLMEYCEDDTIRRLVHTLTVLAHDRKQMIESLWLTWLMTAIYLVIFVLGTIGNMITMAVIYNTPSLHSHTNYFLSSLALSDFLLVLVGVPFDLISLWHPLRPPEFPGYCQIHSMYLSCRQTIVFVGSLIGLFTNVSIMTITSLTVERFVAICYPFSLRSLFDKPRVLQLIKIMWVVALIPSLFIGIQFEQIREPDICNLTSKDYGGSCDFRPIFTFPPYPFETMLVIMFVLPMVFIIFCYAKILKTLGEMALVTTVHLPVINTTSDSTNGGGLLYVHTRNSAPPKSQQAQAMVIRMLVIVSAVFFVCYLPYHCQRLVVHYLGNKCGPICWFLYPITGALQYISAALNPLFYNAMSLRFRTAFQYCLKRVMMGHHYKSVNRAEL